MSKEKHSDRMTPDQEKSGTRPVTPDEKESEQALRESEEKFRSLVEGANVGVYLIQDGVFRYVNSTWAEMLGYTIEEMTDKITLEDVVHPEDYRGFSAENIRRLAGEVESLGYEVRLVIKSGKIRYAEAHGSRTVYKGKPAVIGTIEDVTRRKHAEVALLQSHERYRALSEATFEGIILTEEGRFLEVNYQFARMLGYKKNELIGKDVISVIVPEDRLSLVKNIIKRYESIIETRMVGKNGTVITVEAHGKPFVYEGHHV